MAIRIREVNGKLIAICAARSVPKKDDIYLHDGIHGALSEKFSRDFDEMFDLDFEHNPEIVALVEQEESNNPNRDEWDKTYGAEQRQIRVRENMNAKTVIRMAKARGLKVQGMSAWGLKQKLLEYARQMRYQYNLLDANEAFGMIRDECVEIGSDVMKLLDAPDVQQLAKDSPTRRSQILRAGKVTQAYIAAARASKTPDALQKAIKNGAILLQRAASRLE